MRDFLSQILSRLQATDRQQRLYMALGLAIVVVVLRFGVTWVGEYRSDTKAEIQLSARRLVNARQLLEQTGVVTERLDSLRRRYKTMVGELIPGQTATLASASLQERVTAVARDNNVRIQSTQVLQEEELGSFTEVSLRVTAQSGIGSLAKFLATLEYGPPRIDVEFLELSRRASSVRRRRKRDKLDLSRVVSATLQISAISQGSAGGIVPVRAQAGHAVAAPPRESSRRDLPQNPLGTQTSPPENGT
ncbi:MAG: type II secretion system protein GspM [Deltaproteobacteria bacterium]